VTFDQTAEVHLLLDAEIAAWLPADGGRVLAEVLARSEEPHRRYHDAGHVRAVISRVIVLLDDLSVGVVADPASVVWAALWHDAIYDPHSATNEADSAILASDTLGALGVAEARLSEVARLIMLTAGHQVDLADTAGGVLVDADLAILGGDAAEYSAYVDGVRSEYAFVDDDAWRVGRARVLEGLLALPRIFSTPPMQARNAPARENLTSELRALRNSRR
jgi:predicted metal-dependent HD superfamily phosphohydrolase